jgi:hypothetical protein
MRHIASGQGVAFRPKPACPVTGQPIRENQQALSARGRALASLITQFICKASLVPGEHGHFT